MPTKKVESKVDEWILIVNPYASSNRQKGVYLQFIEELKKNNFSFEVIHTEYAGHIELLIQQKVEEGFRQFIFSGGDGTNHEAVNALMQQTIAPISDFTAAFIPGGTGNDWARTFNIPHKATDLVKMLETGFTLAQDVGKIEFLDENKQPQTRYFVNVAGIGYDCYLQENYLETGKSNNSSTYLLNTIRGLYHYQNRPFSLVLDGEHRFDGRFFTVAFGICQYYGGGMKICPDANPQDGLIEVVMIRDVGKVNALSTLLPRIKSGKFIEHELVETYRAKTIEIFAEQPERIQAEGELLGFAPFNISIVPQCLYVVVPDSVRF